MRARLDALFREKRERGEAALLVYVTAGLDGLPPLPEMVARFAEAGADAIEIGIPFSDPIADGPVIQAASQRALEAGFRVDRDLWPQVREARTAGVGIPLLGMTYYNLVLRRGLERFAAESREAGLDGLIIPDLPVEEAGELAGRCRAEDLYWIPLLAPTSTDERIQATAAAADGGFLYCVSATGVTGVRDASEDEGAALVARARRFTQLPLAIGFGIGTPERARAAARIADGVIVGSAVVRHLLDGADGFEPALQLVAAMKQAMTAS